MTVSILQQWQDEYEMKEIPDSWRTIRKREGNDRNEGLI